MASCVYATLPATASAATATMCVILESQEKKNRKRIGMIIIAGTAAKTVAENGLVRLTCY